jgi:4-hydroxybenzoate polyprenyltransferase
MTALQASIGALNDVIDAPRDAGRKPSKPIPAGLVSADLGRSVVVAAATVGLLLSVPSGPPVVALAGVVLAIGYAYDLRFRGTPWSWVPFAIGIPILPVFGWLGAAGSLPAAFLVLVPTGVLAGAGLAIANTRADFERDHAAGVRSVATALGLERAWAVHAVLLGIVLVLAIGTLAVVDAPGQLIVGALGAVALVAVGMGIGRSGGPVARERAWELEAVGIGLLAAAWLAGVASGRPTG